MGRRLLWRATIALVVVFAVFGAAQLVRPARTNPAIDPAQTIEVQLGTASGLIAVLDRACADCHSNATVWERYPRIVPVSWAVALGVRQGRQALNFSEWGAYSPVVRRKLLDASCRDARRGSMPMPIYLRLRSEARLTASDVETICAAARDLGVTSAGDGQPR